MSIFAEATWRDSSIDLSSCLPIHRGVCCTTLAGVTATWVGNRWLPRVQPLARNTSPAMNGRRLRTITHDSITARMRSAAAA